MFIKLLDKNLSNMIAAGEVVERPASAIKEMIENSVDAGAGVVTVKIVGGGLKMIKVTDNGCGMDDQAMRALRERAEETRGDDQAEHVSIGITNVISRMRLTFGHRFSYDIQSAPEQGFSVRLRVEGE